MLQKANWFDRSRASIYGLPMRLIGVAVLLIFCSISIGQVTGSIDTIGFDNTIRPDCWTPLVVTLNPTSEKTDFYQIRLKVDDMDRDSPVYTRTISLTGVPSGQSLQQKFRMYFIPPPTDGGVSDWNTPGALKDLQEKVHASINTTSGKWIADLPITTAVKNIDPITGTFEARRGTKLVLVISSGNSRPVYANPADQLAGVLEDVAFVQLQPGDLPERELGYQAVDAIVWLDADPSTLRAGGDEKFRALRSWVAGGGKLIIGQPFDWQKILGLDDLLPVTDISIEQKADLSPLKDLSASTAAQQSLGINPDPFAGCKPPFRFARAKAKPGTMVDRWIDWSPTDHSPYIVRQTYGSGCVSWVAQDLGDPSLNTGKDGWANVWNHIFDWQNQPFADSEKLSDAVKNPWREGIPVDLGRSLLGGMDLSAKGLWLVSVAILFFMVYWFVAGPGAYLVLAARKATQSSWFIFGACALVATALTVLMVKLVLRGPPELKHFSVARVSTDGQADVRSHFGLYIPRDGDQELALHDADTQQDAALSPLPIHPDLLKKSPDQPGQQYIVPIVDQAAGQNVVMSVPYRSTLKKFEALWSGKLSGNVQGSGKLIESGWIDGTITNGTGYPLRNIYVAFKYETAERDNAANGNWLLYIPSWDKGVSLNLKSIFNDGDVDPNSNSSRAPSVPFVSDDRPPVGHRVRGKIERDWSTYWFAHLARSVGPMNESYDDSNSSVRASLPLLSFFDALPPSQNIREAGGYRRNSRVDLLRRGGRSLDVTGALSGGSLVVLAEADTPLPVPLTVDDAPVTGTGETFYQFVLPLDHSQINSATPNP